MEKEEFMYNNSNISTWMSPYQIMQGRIPHGVSDLAELSIEKEKSANAKSFVDHMKEEHKTVKRQIEKSNMVYTLRD